MGVEGLTGDIRSAFYSLCTRIAEGKTDILSFYVQRLTEQINELLRYGVKVDSFIRKLSKTENFQKFLDIYYEGEFACILTRNGFSRVEIEFSPQGPDIRANYNRQTIYFEVARRRPGIEDTSRWSNKDFTGAKPKATANILGIIDGKLEQLVSGEINVMVYWSSTMGVSHDVMRNALLSLQPKIAEKPEHYQKLSGILHRENYATQIPSLEQFLLFKNDHAARPLGTRLTKKLGSLHDKDIKTLRKETAHLTKYFYR